MPNPSNLTAVEDIKRVQEVSSLVSKGSSSIPTTTSWWRRAATPTYRNAPTNFENSFSRMGIHISKAGFRNQLELVRQLFPRQLPYEAH